MYVIATSIHTHTHMPRGKCSNAAGGAGAGAPPHRGKEKPPLGQKHFSLLKTCSRCGEEQKAVDGEETTPSPTLATSWDSLLECSACGSYTHSKCAHSRAVSKMVKGKARFFCSTECLLDVNLQLNPHFQADLCERVERWCAVEWEKLTVRDASNSIESRDRVIDNRYRHLRLRAWCQYFELEAADGLPLILLPRHVHENLPAPDGEALYRLLTPAGQAHALHTLHPKTHPVGCVVAAPSEKWWNTLTPPLSAMGKEERKEEQATTRKRGRKPNRTLVEQTVAIEHRESHHSIASVHPMDAVALRTATLDIWKSIS